jgi:hypothetical protein
MYFFSRLNYRYYANNLPNDPNIGTATAASGGTAQPKGKDGEASTEVKLGDGNKLQTRYNNFHTWVPVIQCQTPDRYRWGKAGRDYRGLRKTWITDDLTRKSHTQIKPAVVVKTPIADLGLGAPPAAAKPEGNGGSATAPAPTEGKSGCGCWVGESAPPGAGLALAVLGVGSWLSRRRRR